MARDEQDEIARVRHVCDQRVCALIEHGGTVEPRVGLGHLRSETHSE
jgi:hypothetical protein